MLKGVYVQHGPEGMDQAAFRVLWREHWEIARDTRDFFDHVRRYVQGDSRNDLDHEFGQSSAYQGVGEIYYADLAARDAAATCKGMRESLLPHSAQFFAADPVVRLTGDEKEYIAPQEDGGLKVFTFFRRRSDLSDEAFWESLAAAAKRLIEDDRLQPLIKGYTQTIALTPDRYDAMDEISFASLEDMRSAWEILRGEAGIRSDQDDYADMSDRLILIVEPNLFHDDRQAYA